MNKDNGYCSADDVCAECGDDLAANEYDICWCCEQDRFELELHAERVAEQTEDALAVREATL